MVVITGQSALRGSGSADGWGTVVSAARWTVISEGRASRSNSPR